jgi:signal transduction histidine kinase
MNYRRLWKNTLGAGVGVSLLPLLLVSLISFYQFEAQYDLQRGDIVSQMELLLSNTRLQLSDFLKERQSALAYVVRENSFAHMADPAQLQRIFVNLRASFGGFVDLGLIDSRGLHRAYVGPYALEGHNYSEEDWFKEAVLRGVHISEVFLGHRRVPHIVIAVRHDQDQGGFHILRATINTARLQDMLADVSRGRSRDAFIISRLGVLQTASLNFGGVLEKFPLELPPVSNQITMADAQAGGGRPMLVGYAWVPDSPFGLVLVKYPQTVLAKWSLLRINLMLLVAFSALAIMAVLFKGATSLVSRLHDADLRKAAVLHEIEYTNKLASIGRLAAGVAHEINNPIAIINEKAGLLRDLVTMREDSELKPKYLKSIDSILGSVKRVSTITHRLLGFARHLDIKSETIHLELLMQEVLGFLGKEAEYRNIDINVSIPPDIPSIESDRGQLQQVLLNILNNALAAMPQGGEVNISAARVGPDRVAVSISDNGAGIPKEHQERIFEPFFSTRGEKGTGLGLSITYGIVQKLGGQIELNSQPGEGTTFTIILPRKPPA